MDVAKLRSLFGAFLSYPNTWTCSHPSSVCKLSWNLFTQNSLRRSPPFPHNQEILQQLPEKKIRKRELGQSLKCLLSGVRTKP